MIRAIKDFTAVVNGRKYSFKKGAEVKAPRAAIELFGDAVKESKQTDEKEKEKAND